MSIESLKEQARRHEQQEDWARALGLYLQAIDEAAKDEQTDISLYNRAGDIQTRMGNLDGAALHYEQAIDLYLEADLPNNAIAVCKKVLRNLPDRSGMFLRMGQIRASQGFLTDARQNFLTYAERMQRLGQMEEAFRALREFADAVPADLEIRMALASQLDGLGRTVEAVEQYQAAYTQLVRSGNTEGAAEVEARIRTLDPAARVGVEPAPPAGGDDFFIESTSLHEEEASDSAVRMDPAGGTPSSSDGLDVETFEALGVEEIDQEPLGLPDDLPAGTHSWDELPPEEAVPFLETQAVASGFDGEWIEDPEEGEGAAPSSDDGPPGGIPAELDLGEADADIGVQSEEVEDLPFFAFPGELEDEGDDEGEGEYRQVLLEAIIEEIAVEVEEEEAAFPAPPELPFLEVGPAESGGVEVAEAEDALAVQEAHATGMGGSELDDLLTLLADGPDDGHLRLEIARIQMSEGGLDEARSHLLRAHELLLGSGSLDEALDAARLLQEGEPDHLGHHQRIVETAARFPDRSYLVEALLSLADALARTGDAGKARATYEQVLALHPGHLAALEGLGGKVPAERPASTVEDASPAVVDPPAPVTASARVPTLETPPPGLSAPVRRPPPPPPGETDYVDLGSLVLDDQPERTTRWFVPAEEPSGDDDADFARMLTQFKAKVAENLAGDDATGHYDLGAAYREMGLLQEAIAEFQQSLRADPRNLGTFEMLGQCFLDEGQPEVAIRTLNRALALGFDVEDDLLGIYYYLGKSHQSLGNSEMAREFYEKVFSLDINFKDVTERLRALR